MTKENGESINGTIHKIRVINQYSFEIGNTTEYSPYEVDGLARNMKIPIKVEFKSFEESIKLCNIDDNLAFYDFEKSTKNTILHNCFITLSNYREKCNKYPSPWNWEDGETFLSMLKEIYTEELKTSEINFIRTFAYTCSGNFAPLAAFYGGLTAQ
jgi:ubiquitin-activating enzyme E1